ncbi:MAG: hypothetical protein JNL98_01330 [Bryobacterales bacterium]|nr:hypothetical protein [Bryobacterales bacterium]
MEWYEPEVALLESAARAGQVRPCLTVFYGSSSIRMWDTLAQDLASDRVLNRGFGGSTLAACVHFFERLVMPVRPASLVLYAGDNDLGDGRTVDQVVASFEQFQAKVDQSLGGVPFAFLAIKPSPARASILGRIVEANNRIANFIHRRGSGTLFVDTLAAMLTPDGKPDPLFFLDDGLHLSRSGYRLWAELLQPYRKQLLIEPTS